jgi:2-polyprenyl-3-methyl-5-hydroxy-6-metoxy-1,4-benzoquinol methylase
MKKTALEKNKEYSDKFIQLTNNSKVPEEIEKIILNEKIKSIIDLGCGDGILIHSIKKEFPKIKISGVDISPRRINGLKEKFPKDNFYVKDVCDTKLKNKFDFVHSSQVIEHVVEDKRLVVEMSRLLKKGGILFCSSVIKKPWAIYKYRNNGKFVLDPTHEKEYRNSKEFLDLFKKNFKLITYSVGQTRRKKFGLNFKIPGFYEMSGIWRKR